jgi:DNA-directed RNA polymerase subunit RPC12/RpoP
VALARQVRTASTAAAAVKALHMLEKYFERTKNDDTWIMCKNCGFRALCPHVKDRIILESRRSSYEEIRTSLMKYAVQIQSSEGESYTYYCKICSERLAEIIEEDRTAETLGRFGNLDYRPRGILSL